ncbi:hypothetical protein [Embleya sp. NPDC056538]|uniref:hypothetical protein n=1 Tax=Embleya sp. NPDC056538 TaxID=3345858 RepID=UPI003688BFBA
MKMRARTALAVLATTAALGGFGAVVTTAHAAERDAPAAPSRPADTEPAPNCSNNSNHKPCWEYQTWHWTYDNCNKAGTAAVNADRGKFDNHVCVLTGNGVGVGLWLHKLHD